MSATTSPQPLKKGEVVRILPRFRDPGDHAFIWMTADNEEKGRVAISPVNIGIRPIPHQVVESRMVERHPCPNLTTSEMLEKCGLSKRVEDTLKPWNQPAEIFDPEDPEEVLFTGRATEVTEWLCDHYGDRLRQT